MVPALWAASRPLLPVGDPHNGGHTPLGKASRGPCLPSQVAVSERPHSGPPPAPFLPRPPTHTHRGWRGTGGVGVRLAGVAQHVAALDHVGARSAAAAAPAAATPTTSSSRAAATAAAATAGDAATATAGDAAAAGGTGNHLAARDIHGHGTAGGHGLRGGGGADLGGRARRLVVAGARRLRVERRLGVRVGAGAAGKRNRGVGWVRVQSENCGVRGWGAGSTLRGCTSLEPGRTLGARGGGSEV